MENQNGNYRDYEGLCMDYIGIIGHILGVEKDNGKYTGNFYLEFRGFGRLGFRIFWGLGSRV